ELLWDVPLSLTFRGDRFASSYLLAPSGSAVLASPVPGSEATLSARVKALPKQKLQLQLLSGKDLVFRQTVSLHEAISVECDVLGEGRQGAATVTLERHRPQQLDVRAEEGGRTGRHLRDQRTESPGRSWRASAQLSPHAPQGIE